MAGVIITVFGYDRPGILAELKAALSRAGEAVDVRVVTQHEEPFASICRP